MAAVRGRGRRYANRNYRRDAKGRFAHTGTSVRGFAKRHKRGLMIAGGVAVAAGASYGAYRYRRVPGYPGAHPLLVKHQHMIYLRVSPKGVSQRSQGVFKGYRPLYSTRTHRYYRDSYETRFIHGQAFASKPRGFFRVNKRPLRIQAQNWVNSTSRDSQGRLILPGNERVIRYFPPKARRSMKVKEAKALRKAFEPLVTYKRSSKDKAFLGSKRVRQLHYTIQRRNEFRASQQTIRSSGASPPRVRRSRKQQRDAMRDLSRRFGKK